MKFWVASRSWEQKISENHAIETYLKKQIEAFKEHVFTHIPASLVNKILESILNGINEAICVQKAEWEPNTNIQQFTKAMHTIIEFSQLLILPTRKHLDLQHIPQMIRHCFFKELHKFSNLTTLILGSGSGGWGRSYHYRWFSLVWSHFCGKIYYLLQTHFQKMLILTSKVIV